MLPPSSKLRKIPDDLVVALCGVLLIAVLGRWLGVEPDSAPVLQRPQIPQPPFPYLSQDVSFRSGDLQLAGTLTLPPGEGPFAAVLLISGAGAQDRDGTLAGHRRYLVQADALSRAGIAVLRTDDRGVGGSAGHTMNARLDDLAGDARAALTWLARQPRIDPRRLGLIGASQGSLVAALAAVAEDPPVAFVALVSPPGLPGRDTLVEQNVLVARAAGADTAQQAEIREVLDEALAVLDQGLDEQRLRQRVRQLARRLGTAPAAGLEALTAGSQVERMVDVWLSPAMRDQLAYDPRPTLRRLRQPVLVLSGELDLQVPPDLHVPALTAVFEEAGHRQVEIVRLPGLNHLLQPAILGLPEEYGEIEITLAPEALRVLVDWVVERAAGPAPPAAAEGAP